MSGDTVVLIEPDLAVVIVPSTEVILVVPDAETIIVEPNAPGPSGPQGDKGDNAVADIAFAFQGNLMDGEELVGYAIAHGMTLSSVDSVARCVGAPTGDVVLLISKQNGLVTSSVGNVTFLAGQKTGTVVLTITTLVAGDVVHFEGPDPADPTFTSVTVTLAGTLP